MICKLPKVNLCIAKSVKKIFSQPSKCFRVRVDKPTIKDDSDLLIKLKNLIDSVHIVRCNKEAMTFVIASLLLGRLSLKGFAVSTLAVGGIHFMRTYCN